MARLRMPPWTLTSHLPPVDPDIGVFVTQFLIATRVFKRALLQTNLFPRGPKPFHASATNLGPQPTNPFAHNSNSATAYAVCR